MTHILSLCLAVCLPGLSLAQADSSLVAHWSLDEGAGDLTRDLSGNGNHGHLHGPEWVKRGEGFALRFDGKDDWVDCGSGPSLDLTKAVTIAAWVCPETVPSAEPMIVGKYYDSFGLTHYKDGGAWWYISGGGNNLRANLELGKWSRLVGTFDGTTMALYIDRQLVGSKRSKADTINRGKSFLMGVLLADPNATDPGYGGTAYWRGLLDEVRVYDRALTEEEVLQGYKQAAGGFGVDTTWFDRVRVQPYVFRQKGRVLALCDFGGVFPRPADAGLELTLVAEGGGEPLARQQVRPLPSGDCVAVDFDLKDIPTGRYAIRAVVSAPSGLRATGECALQHPAPEPAVPSPQEKRVADLPPPIPEPRFRVLPQPGGGFTLELDGKSLPFESLYSFPNAGDNRLAAGPVDRKGEPEWRVETRPGASGYEAVARGKYYSVGRTVQVFDHRVVIRDTITNETDEDLGVIVNNRADLTGMPWQRSWVAGYPEGGRRVEAESPTSFVSWDRAGIGIVPLDDVYGIQGTVYAADGHAGALTDKFALPPHDSYTFIWVVYPCASPDYFDFINIVRKDLGRTRTVEGGFAFISQDGVSREYVDLRGLKYGSFGCLSHVADDPEIEIEGIDFLWLPKERARLRQQFEAIRKVAPELKLMFHIAHSLVSTNKPDTLFPDSRVLDEKGNQYIYPYDYDACAYFSKQRHQEGWRWYIYYPTPGNSFHDALLKSVDVLVDDIGATGAFMDGFMYGYASRYTHDRWDGRTAEIDLVTKTIKRKMGSVLLLSQPSLAEFVRRMDARGATVIANNGLMTPTVGALPMLNDQECRSGPDVHLCQCPASLGNPTVIHNEQDVYKDVLDKLKWGNLYFYYGEGNLTYPSVPRRMYPITVRELHSGTIIGDERLITMHSGAYGWRDDRDLHQSWRFNPLGMEVPAEFLTTADGQGVRTQVDLQANESAVVRKVPIQLRSATPVNLVLEEYGPEQIALTLSGRGQVELIVRDGEFGVKPGTRFSIGGDSATATTNADGALHVALTLTGQQTVAIRRQ